MALARWIARASRRCGPTSVRRQHRGEAARRRCASPSSCPPTGRRTASAHTVARLRADLDTLAADGGLEIVVVDDGSTDDTAERGRGAPAPTGRRPAREPGQGRRGARRGAGRHGSHHRLHRRRPRLLARPDPRACVEQVEAGWDVVVGSRRHTDTTTLVRARRLREIGGRVINLLTRAVLLGQYRDTQCGLKAFRSDVARLIFAHTRVDGFAFDVEVFHLVERYHLSLTEVPVRVENSARSTVQGRPRRAAPGPRPLPGAAVVGRGPLRPRPPTTCWRRPERPPHRPGTPLGLN